MTEPGAALPGGRLIRETIAATLNLKRTTVLSVHGVEPSAPPDLALVAQFGLPLLV